MTSDISQPHAHLTQLEENATHTCPHTQAHICPTLSTVTVIDMGDGLPSNPSREHGQFYLAVASSEF